MRREHALWYVSEGRQRLPDEGRMRASWRKQPDGGSVAELAWYDVRGGDHS